MKACNDPGTLAPLDVQRTPPLRLPLAGRIVRHWVVRLLITWFGFGILTAGLVAGLQALSVDISPIVSIGVLAVCALLAVFAVTVGIERRNPADIGLSLRCLVIDWLKGAGVGTT
jgi:hypothetical protein